MLGFNPPERSNDRYVITETGGDTAEPGTTGDNTLNSLVSAIAKEVPISSVAVTVIGGIITGLIISRFRE